MNEAERLALLEQFREESAEHSEAVSRALLALEASPGDEALTGEILRRAHSLKGAARVVGVTAVETAAAAFETVLAEVKSGRLPLDRRGMNTLLAALDAITAWGSSEEGEAGLQMAASRLMSLASLTGSLDENLALLLPGLDISFKDVLTEYQKSRLVSACGSGKACWEAALSVAPAWFAARADAARDGLRSVGELVSLAGLAPLPDGTLRFKFLLVTRLAPEAVLAAGVKLSLELTDPSLPGTGPRPAEPPRLSAEEEAAEAAFQKDLADLFPRYVAAEYEKIDDITRLVLAVEKKPDDQEAVNELFRAAHNLKSSGATFGLQPVAKLAHQMETVIAAIRDNKALMTARATNALLKGADTLKELFSAAKAGKATDALPAAVIKELESAFLTEATPAPAMPLSAANVCAPRETIRVKLARLELLVNLSDELTISRNTRKAAVRELESLAEEAKSALRQGDALREGLQASGLFRGGLAEKYYTACAGLAALKEGLDAAWNRFSATTLHSESVAEALQDGVLRIRLVPVSTLFDSAPRLIRDLTADKLKEVTLKISGGETEIDRRVLELMSDPLLHLLRNAVDHGIEPCAERRQAGKPEAGAIELFAEHRGNYVIIEVSDDGRGLDPARLTAKAVEKKLIRAEEAGRITPERAYSFIFHPGFSTAEQVTSISGRGVGMDVVRSNIDALTGRVETESAVGRGTKFRIFLPLSISVIQTVLVEAGGGRFCFHAGALSGVIGAGDEDIRREDGKACIFYGGKPVPLVRLADLLGLKGGPAPEGRRKVLVVSGTAGMMGFVVDRVLREETVVLKELKPPFRRVPHVAGGTILADGRVSVILDTPSLISAAVSAGAAWPAELPQTRPAPRRRVLIVDDSLTTRQLLRSLVEGGGYAVELAANGAEAWELLGRKPFDLVVSDVSMPEMDGYELTARIKADARLAGLPVVLVTALEKEEERLRGLRAGADAYIIKGAFDQSGLLARLKELTG